MDENDFINFLTEDMIDQMARNGYINKRKVTHFKGSGLIGDMVGKVKDFFTKRTDFNNISRKTLEKYGSYPISKIQLARQPILKVLDSVVNFISFGKWNELKRKYNFDDLFHLGMIVTVNLPSGIQKNVMIEKIDAVTISDTISMTGSNVDYFDVPLNGKQITISEMVEKALNAIGPKKFFDYSGLGIGNQPPNNCQYFLMYLLENSGLLTKSAKDFLMQDVEELAREMPELSKKIMNTVTDLGQLSNKWLGKGKLIGGELPPPEAMEQMSKEERRRLKAARTAQSAQSALKKQASRQRLERMRVGTPEYELWKKRDENAAIYAQFKRTHPNWKGLADMEEEDRQAYFDYLKQQQKKYSDKKDAETEATRRQWAKEDAEANRDILDDAFDFVKDAVIDEGIAAVGNAVGKFVGVPAAGDLAKEGLKAGRKALGLGKDGYELHAVIFPKSYGLENAIKKTQEITKNKKLKYYRETKTSYRMRVIPKTKFEKKTFKSHKTPDFTLIYGKLKK